MEEMIVLLLDELIRQCEMDSRKEARVLEDILRGTRRKWSGIRV